MAELVDGESWQGPQESLLIQTPQKRADSEEGNDSPKVPRQIAGLAGASALALKSGYLASNATLALPVLCDLSLPFLIYKWVCCED